MKYYTSSRARRFDNHKGWLGKSSPTLRWSAEAPATAVLEVILPVHGITEMGTANKLGVFSFNRREALDVALDLISTVAAADGMDSGAEIQIGLPPVDRETTLRNSLSVLSELQVRVQRELRDHAQLRQKKG